jgi:SH3-like domain-containing protein
MLAAGVSAAPPSTAVVSRDQVNLRAEASMTGEIIAQLQKGETVTVLETVTPAHPEADAPAAWAKIRLPSDTPVWVYAPSIDAATKTVRVRTLHVRAGPGPNFSIIGAIAKGTPVTDIRILDDWMEITAPSNTFAFVAAQFLDRGGTAAPPAAAQTAPIVSTPATRPVPPPPPEPKATAPVVTNVAPPSVRPATAPAAQLPPPLPPAVTPAEPKPEPPAPATATVVPGRKRIVRREGIVRDTLSIQAPTDYKLVGTDTGEVLDYLLPATPDIKLRPYRGQRIIVSGEEQFDPRWKITPMIVVQSIELAP